MHKFDKRNQLRHRKIAKAIRLQAAEAPRRGIDYFPVEHTFVPSHARQQKLRGVSVDLVLTDEIPIVDSPRLVYAAIRRDDVVHGGFQSHAAIRRELGDENPYESRISDREGFLTSRDEFVSRSEAVRVGVSSGQLSPDWLTVRRPLLSSDVRW